MNHRRLRRLFEAACRDKKPELFYQDMRNDIASGHIRPSDFSIRQLFENFVPDGRELVETFRPGAASGYNVMLLEDAGAVSTVHFTNITGQIVYSTVLAKYNDPNFLADQLFTTVPTQFDGEKIPGIGRIGDQAEAIAEGASYPYAGVSEEWIETPQTIKRGFIVPVTKEAIFFDRTGLVLERAGEVAQWIGVNKEKRCLDVALGITTTYKRNGAAAAATYGDTPFDNLAASNALVDWTNIENAELLFDGLTDPNTGEPISVIPDTIIVPTALKHTAKRIVNATNVRFGPGGSTSATAITADSPSPINGSQYAILSSPYVKSRTSSASTWFIGQPKRAFVYMQNWPITVTQAPANSEAEFTNDIVSRFKVSERGAAGVKEPRFMVKATA